MTRKTILILSLALVGILTLAAGVRPAAAQPGQSEVTITHVLKSDGSSTLTIEFLFKYLEENFGVDITSRDPCADFEESAGDGWLSQAASIEEVKHGVKRYCAAKLEFDDLQEAEDFFTNELSAVVTKLSLEDNQFVYDITVDMSYGPDDLTWQVEVPGRVTEDNADTSRGKVLTWDLGGSPGEVRIHVEGSMGFSLPGMDFLGDYTWAALIGVLCLCLLVVIGAGLVIFFIVRKKK